MAATMGWRSVLDYIRKYVSCTTNLIKIMNSREKKLFFVVLVLLAAILFNIESIKKKNSIINTNKELINSYKERINSSNLVIDSLQKAIKQAKKTDTVIKIRYKQKIDSIYVYKHDDYISFYDTLLHTNLQKTDTFICFDSISVQKLTIKLVNCSLDSELLANCLIQNNLYTNIINIQDSVISLKDSVNASLEAMYKQKVKKVKRQRNTFAGATLVEFLVILGLISK